VRLGWWRTGLTGRQSQFFVALALLWTEALIGVVQEQQVLALDGDTSILELCASAARTPQWMIECSRNKAKLVLVAMPETPEIETWPPRVPSTNSKLR
jgi:hypothetical protein